MSPTIKPTRERKGKKWKWVADLRKFGFGRFYFNEKIDAEKEIERRLVDVENLGKLAVASGEEIAEMKRLKLRLATTGKTVADAVEYFLAHYKPVANCAYAKASEIYVDWKLKTGKRERYYGALEDILNAFGGQLEEGLQVHEITRSQIDGWIFGRELSFVTRKGYLGALKTFFKWCVKQRYCAESPCDGFERIETENKPPTILSVQQCRDLMGAATDKKHKEMVPYLTLALFCGIRPEEAIKISWEEIYIERGFVEVRAEISKTRQRRIVELSENAKAWFQFGIKQPVAPRGWRDKFEAIRKAAGVYDDWSQDVMRHSFASYHLAMYGSQDKTATQLGHRSSQMLFQHYRELVAKDEAERFWSILP